MNLIAICLHSLDMRDFHSDLRSTPFLDGLRARAVFVPMGRGQGHNQYDSLNSELTGVWTARMSDSALGPDGYKPPRRYTLPETVIEKMADAGRAVFTRIAGETFAVEGGMKKFWLAEQPERLGQFSRNGGASAKDWLKRVAACRSPFYAHRFIRHTHRNWGSEKPLAELLGMSPPSLYAWYDQDIWCARRAAIEKPEEFSAIRRRGLALADAEVKSIFEATSHQKDTAYLVYSNHGEVFDHFRHVLPHRINGRGMLECTSHGNFPYEVVYANMQLWLIPGVEPRVMRGIGRSVDIAPTLLQLAGLPAGDLDGESMLPHFKDGAFPDRDRYAEGPGCVSMVRADGMKVISRVPTPKATGRALSFLRKCADLCPPLKKIPHLDGGGYGSLPLSDKCWHELSVFDLKADPYEYCDLAATPAGREAIAWAVARHHELKSRPAG